MAIKSVNPYTLETLKTFDEITDSQLEKAIDTAHDAYLDWKKTSYEDRAALLNKIAATFRSKKKELSEMITTEMGKLIGQSEYEIEYCANIFEYYAKNGAEFLADQKITTAVGEAVLTKAPIGVILAVEPWNFPFYQVARVVAPNLMIGNTIVLKHSSNVPQCAQAFQDIFTEIQAPKGLYTNLFLSSKKIEKLIENPKIQGACLTGSEKAGASLAQFAGKNIKKSVLELGGNDPFIVLEDADIDRATDLAIKGRMINNGQSCVASKRFIVLEQVADAFLEKFTKKMEALKLGDPMDKETQLGPLSSQDALDTLLEQVNTTIKQGATVVTGGKQANLKGAFMQPTILTHLKPDMLAYQEELFGPVASFYRVKNDEEAIELANATRFGLGSSIFSKDMERAKNMAKQIDSGMVFINQPTKSNESLPFGGTKRSGYGRELSALGMDEFVNKKLIHAVSETDIL
ncbi:NAD-dependent succinate-semialdehyde dehydrogenase [Flavobacterium sp. SOK18b]|uniref:NAD-dependent succinate-semialdehyde dehydrogenase n=1 Tax=Flavobacterium sp. SOK18b TaxID=797900 RepID=UPI0015FB8CF9|nr:NAD-dependent succinate-semialdehyde dehydrogenase [Flavobacterium sp. SOK18b]MBB1192838.1 NAD-dependent succinate-semialdehyde dehydrogenase [Flavobacterium sp. SOK18b]